MSFRASKQEHYYEFMEIRGFSHCPSLPIKEEEVEKKKEKKKLEFLGKGLCFS